MRISVIVLFMLIVGLGGLYGGDLVELRYLNKSQLQQGSVLSLVDPDFSSESLKAGSQHVQRQSIVELRYQGMKCFAKLAPWRVKVVVNFNGESNISLFLYQLDSESQSQYRDAYVSDYPSSINDLEIVSVNYYEYLNGNWVAGSSGIAPEDLILELRLEKDRREQTNSLSVPFMYYDTSTDSLYWSHVEGAESYDLEWVFIDKEDRNYSLIISSTQDTDPYFPFNIYEPVGVNTSCNFYDFNVPFESGRVYFRVRGVSYYIDHINHEYDHPNSGHWGYYSSALGGSLVYKNVDTGFEDNKNWICSAVYAEEGKNKLSVVYADGTQRTRQTLSRINSGDYIVATSNIYDYEGREAVSVLPAPIDTRDLNFISNLNLDQTNTDEFKAEDFDVTFTNSSISCKMGTGSGASNYYSSVSVFESPYSEMVPYAEGYPYSRKVYTPDNTGRIQEQSAPGLMLSSQYADESSGIEGHTTKNYYCYPLENDLVRLFGSNLGEMQGYRKQYTRDSNGEYSITYTDNQGRTIATSMISIDPQDYWKQNLEPLDEFKSAPNMVHNLSGYNNKVYSDNGIMYRLETQIYNPLEGMGYLFNYDVNQIAATYFGDPMVKEYRTGFELAEESIFDGGLEQSLVSDSIFSPATGSEHSMMLEQNLSLIPSITVPVFESDVITLDFSCYGDADIDIRYSVIDLYGQIVSTSGGSALLGSTSLSGQPSWQSVSTIDLPAMFSGVGTALPTGLSKNICFLHIEFIPPTSSDTLYIDDVNLHIERDGPLICPTCQYDLSFKIINPKDILIYADTVTIVGGDLVNCSTVNSDGSYNLNSHIFSQNFTFNEIGNYTVIKELEFNYGAIDDYVENYLIDFPDYPGDSTAIYADLSANNASSINCYYTCEEYYAAYFADCTSWLDSVTKYCDSYQSSGYSIPFEVMQSSCESIYYSLLADVSPVNGQSTIPITNLYYQAGWLDSLWQYELTGFYDRQGNLLPPSLQPDDSTDLKEHWNPEWAHTLVKYHPGYCQYEGCLRENEFNKFLFTLYDPEIEWQSGYADSTLGTNPILSDTLFSSALEDSLDAHNCSTLVSAIDDLKEKVFISGFYTKCSFQDMVVPTNQNPSPLGEPLVIYDCPTPPYTTVNYSLVQFTAPSDGTDNNPMYLTNLSSTVNEYRWKLFATFYAGLRSELVDEILGCLDTCDYEVFEDPYAEISTTGDAIAAILPKEDLCAAHVEYWKDLIFQDSCIDSIYYDLIDSVLYQACYSHISFSNPMAFLTNEILLYADTLIEDSLGAPLSPHTLVDCLGDNVLSNPYTSISMGWPVLLNYMNSITTLLNGGSSFNVPTASYGSSTYSSWSILLGAQEVEGCDRFNIDLTGNSFNLYLVNNFCDSCNFSVYQYIDSLCPSAMIPYTVNWPELQSIEMLSSIYPTCSPWSNYYGIKVKVSYSDSSNIAFLAVSKLCSNFDFGQMQSIQSLTFFENLKPLYTLEDLEEDCLEYLETEDAYYAQTYSTELLDKYIEVFVESHHQDCFEDKLQEILTVETKDLERHFTLYFYDQAGNLVETVPPNGVDPKRDGSGVYLSGMLTGNDFNANGVWQNQEPNYAGYQTTYKYNSLNALVQQEIPDGKSTATENSRALTKFYYDDIGQLRFSQNQKQLNDQCISYTKYDKIGRAIESGECKKLISSNIVYEANQMDFPVNGVDGSCESMVLTRYDKAMEDVGIANNFENSTQQNLRGRVASIMYIDSIPGEDTSYVHATHYNYDIHGNVNVLLQDYPELQAYGEEFKKIEYKYDLISGNVKEVAYQRGKNDEYYHRYKYDADNRITDVYTSDDEYIWERNAKYFYYPHGPLARVELGEDQIQGMDYAYTLQGWLKGVNSDILDPQYDMGLDGASGTLNSNFAKDAFGYVLGYFDEEGPQGMGDYQSDRTQLSNSFVSQRAGFDKLEDGVHNLFNGNIKHMIIANQGIESHMGSDRYQSLIMGYRYDQLNRIYNAHSYESDYNGSLNAWDLTQSENFSASYQYDPNGNLLALSRKDESGEMFDTLKYQYYGNKNQLELVDDGATAHTPDYDLASGQTPNNYQYDELGNLTQDRQEEIDEIEWTLSGKVKRIIRSESSQKEDLEFKYDALGNRICKIVKPKDAQGNLKPEKDWIYTWYVPDAQGNIMSIYKQDFEYLGLQFGQYTFKGEIKLEEVPMYGSSRLGVYEKEENLASIEFNTDDEYLEGGYFKLKQYDYSSWVVNPYRNWKTREINFTNFELSNHLGNVLAMVTDYKIGIDSIYTYSPGNNGTRKYKNHAFTMQSSGQYTVSLPANPFTVNAYHANIRNATDYYPFGMMIPWRYDDGDDGNFNTSLDIPMNLGEHRFGFNGKEKDDEIKGNGNSLDFGARIYDSRSGRWLAIDPLAGKNPSISPYAYCANNPILFLDEDGKEPITAIIDAITAFAVEAGMSYVENVVLNDMDASTAFDNIRWGDACVEAAKSYGLSLFITGVGSTKALAKASNSKIGKVTMEFTANMVGELMKSYYKGEFNDENGSFNMDKFLNSDFQGLMQGALIEALVAQGFSKKAEELGEKLNKAQANLVKQESKLNESLSRGAPEKTIENRTAKVNNAQKEVVKSMAKTEALSTTKEVASKGTNKANEQRRKK